jgi:hypothetical protein
MGPPLAAPSTRQGSKIMRSTKHLLTAALAATTLLAALATTTAFARSFSVSNTNVRAVFRPLIFQGSNGSNVTCTVTLEGTFHYRTFLKVERTLIGYITRAIVDTPTCRSEGASTNIRARVLTETLPWHVRYIGFIGRLPEVTVRLRLLRAAFDLINVPIVGTCKYNANPEGILGGPEGGAINERTGNATIRADEAIRFPSSTFGCPEGRFVGRAPITLLGTETPIRITLI